MTVVSDFESAHSRIDRRAEALREKVVQLDDRIDRTLNAVVAAVAGKLGVTVPA